MEKEGYGYVVLSVGEVAGVVPYTSFSARSHLFEENPQLLRNFQKAIQKGLDYVHNHSNSEIAEIIKDQFPDTSFELLEDSIKRYRENDTWPKSTTFTEESFNHLQDIMIDYGELTEKVDFNQLIVQFS